MRIIIPYNNSFQSTVGYKDQHVCIWRASLTKDAPSYVSLWQQDLRFFPELIKNKKNWILCHVFLTYFSATSGMQNSVLFVSWSILKIFFSLP